MVNFLEIFPFHENEEKFSYQGVCIIRPVDFDNDLAINMERGPILFNYETEFRVACTILRHFPSNALLFIINLTELFAGGDHSELMGEVLIVSGKSFSNCYGILPDENFKIQLEDACSLNFTTIFTGQIVRKGVLNDYKETFSFCMKFDRNDDLSDSLKRYFMFNGQNHYHEAPDKINYPKLINLENDTIFQWSGITSIKYLNTGFYSLDFNNEIGDEIPLNPIVENLIIDKNSIELIYSLFSVEYRDRNESAFLILYLDQTTSILKTGHNKIVISLDEQMKVLEICEHENNTSLRTESFNVIVDENSILIQGILSFDRRNENIFRFDKYSILIKFEQNYEITEFILDNLRNCHIWYVADDV
jgi:hypothetical protein